MALLRSIHRAQSKMREMSPLTRVMALSDGSAVERDSHCCYAYDSCTLSLKRSLNGLNDLPSQVQAVDPSLFGDGLLVQHHACVSMEVRGVNWAKPQEN